MQYLERFKYSFAPTIELFLITLCLLFLYETISILICQSFPTFHFKEALLQTQRRLLSAMHKLFMTIIYTIIYTKLYFFFHLSAHVLVSLIKPVLASLINSIFVGW